MTKKKNDHMSREALPPGEQSVTIPRQQSRHGCDQEALNQVASQQSGAERGKSRGATEVQ